MSHRKMSVSGNAVFLSLYSPYKALNTQIFASVLEDSIADFGFDKTCIQQNRLDQLVPVFKYVNKGVDPKTVIRWIDGKQIQCF